jgi:exoribonuclease-2
LGIINQSTYHHRKGRQWMDENEVRPGGLVLYKKRPARVARIGERLQIELEGGNLAKVRLKDVTLLHPGPLESLEKLHSNLEGEVQLAWQLLAEDPQRGHNLAELSELIYGIFTPITAWKAWELVNDGLYFHGSPGEIFAHTPSEVEAERIKRQEQAREARAWEDFLERARNDQIDPQGDARYLREVEDLALGRKRESRVLRELGRSERPENAHSLLLACGYWDYSVTPYAQRLGLATSPPSTELSALVESKRLDLTSLESFAIDDRDNQDPDDAISLESYRVDHEGNLLGGRIWIHIADVAALVLPDSPADLEARARGATLYLPGGAVPMLPEDAIRLLGLGLQEISPALSFGLELNADGELTDIRIHPSWVRVRRLSYEAAEERLGEPPFQGLNRLAMAYQARRASNGALFIDLPETIIRVTDGRVNIRQVERLHSRDLVREAMLMAGEAAASFAVEREIPFPYATQEPPDENIVPDMPPTSSQVEGQEHLPTYFAMRRALKRSQVSSLPSPHFGVGLLAYSRATSPLRRYLDLVAHQQLRASLNGEKLLNSSEMLARVGASEAVTGNVNLAEALSRRHWTLVYLLQNPDWQGEAVLVEKGENRNRVLIPELALEIPFQTNLDMSLNSHFLLKVQSVNLPELEAHFTQI